MALQQPAAGDPAQGGDVMAILDSAERAGPLLTGLVVGVAALALAPVLLPTLGRVGRPLAKAALKGAILAYESGRETLAELAELAEDMLAEVRHELAEEAAAARAAEAVVAAAEAETAADG